MTTTATTDAPVVPDTAPPPDRRPGWDVVVPGLVVGALAALIGLDRSSLWRDEAYSLGAVHQVETTLRETRGTMGLYYALLRVWTEIGGDGIWWIRFLSVLLGLAGLVVVVRLVARVADATVARWTGVLLGLSLLWVAYAQEARSYTLVLLLTATSWTALDRALGATDARTRRRWVAVHVATGLLLPLAQGLAVLQVAAQPAALLLARAGRRSWTVVAPGVAAAVAVTGLLTAIGTGEAGSWIAPVDADQLRILVESLTSDIPIAMLGLVALGAGGAVLAVRTARTGTEVERIRALAPVTWTVVPPALLLAISLAGRPTLVPRYVMASAAGLAILWAIALGRAGRRWSLAGVPVVGALVVAALVLGQVRLHDATGDDWRLTARALAAEPMSGDVFLFATSEVRPPFEAAWAELDPEKIVPVVNGPRPLGRVLRVEEVGLSDAEAVDAAKERSRVWVIGEARDPDRAAAVEELVDAGFRSEKVVAESGGVPAELLVRP